RISTVAPVILMRAKRAEDPLLLHAKASQSSKCPGQGSLKGVGERLLFARAVRGVTAGLDPRSAKAVHEISNRQSLPNALRRVDLPSRVDDDHAVRHEQRRQGNVGRD